MEMDVNLSKLSAIELVSVSASSVASLDDSAGSGFSQRQANTNNTNSHHSLQSVVTTTTTTTTTAAPILSKGCWGCCGLLGLLLKSSRSTGKTGTRSVGDYTGFGRNDDLPRAVVASGRSNISIISDSMRKSYQRRPPQEVYFESRGKSCRKLLKFNGSSNKILLYPEEGWARSASSSYWTITLCWWQPNRCVIEEFRGAAQRRSTKASMVPLEQRGSLLIAGSFRHSKNRNKGQGLALRVKESPGEEFKLYLSSNISTEDYNMGYCLTGFVERRCQHTNTFQMTHFAVIKRQWPSTNNDIKPA